MKSIFKYLNHPFLASLCVLMLLVGLLVSKAMLSIGMILLAAYAIINPKVGYHLKLLYKEKDFLFIMSIFFLYALTGLWSEDTGYVIDRLRMKLPFLLMPIAFIAIPRFDRKIFNKYMYFFFWLVTTFSIVSVLQYLGNIQEITENYAKGQVMPTPIQHIRFSLLVVWSICLGLYFIEKRYFLKDKRELYFVGIAILFLIGYIHLLAVRSGLLAFYFIAAFYFLRYLFTRKNLIYSGIFLLVIFASGWLSYKYIPTLEKKINYTWYSIELFQKNENIRELSDSRRLGSIIAGIDIGKQNFWKGVGIGDLKYEINEYLKTSYPELIDLGLLPHNQYIFVFAFAGFLGLLWFLFASLFPIFYHRAWKNGLFIAFNLIFISSFLVEHTIETQIGTAMYIFFLLLMMRVFMQERRASLQS